MYHPSKQNQDAANHTAFETFFHVPPVGGDFIPGLSPKETVKVSKVLQLTVTLTEALGSPAVPAGSRLLLLLAAGPPPRPAHDCTTTR